MWKADRDTARHDVRKLDARYFSPQWLYTLDDLSRLVTWGLTVGLAVILVPYVIRHEPFGPSLVAYILSPFGALFFSSAVAGFINHLLRYWRGGYGLRPNGSNRLVGEFSPGRVSLRVKRRRIEFDAVTPHQFMMREHPERANEARAEERARAMGQPQQPDYFRRAFEIVLDLGTVRHRLAEVATEEEARELIRLIHELDSYARGTASAGTLIRDKTQPGAAPTRRPPL